MSIQLRPYQADLVGEVNDAWASGAQNVLMHLPTGGGKSACLAYVVAQHVGASCIVCHRSELVSQLSQALAQYGVEHDIIASGATRRIVAAVHVQRFGRCYLKVGARCRVASVQTLVRRTGLESWAATVTLWVVDEHHHYVRENSWDKAIGMFTHPQIKGLGPTATPSRADGKGLGRHADGVIDVMISGPSPRWLIEQGWLSDYDVMCPTSDLQVLADVAASGDWSPKALKEASQKSHIVGDVVGSYLEAARGRLGVTFATDVETATQMAAAYRAAGVSSEVLTGETDDRLRAATLARFEKREVLQLCVVDIISEGFDCLSMDTEILTPDGFKFFHEINAGDLCYSLNLETNGMEAVPIEAVASRPAKPGERVYTVKSQHMDIRVTEGHRFFYRSKQPRKPGGHSEDWRMKTAAELFDWQQPFSLPISAEAEFPGLPLSDDEIRLIAWYLTDGCILKGVNLSIGQTKVWGIEKIACILESIGLDYTTRLRPPPKGGFFTDKPSAEFRIPRGTHPGMPRKGWDYLAKYLHKEIVPELHQMDRRQFGIFWESLMDGDGSRQKPNGAGTLTCARKQQTEAYVQMAVTRGYAAMYSTYKSKSGTTIYALRVRDRQFHMMQPKDSRGARHCLEPAEPGEMFWCAENRNGTLVTRRGGKIAILGNCPSIEVMSMARPTASLGLYSQQFGRGLRPVFAPGYPIDTAEQRIAAQHASGKGRRVLLIDHVGNFVRHQGGPDAPRVWTLDRRERRSKGASDAESLRVCTECFKPFKRVMTACPHCGAEIPPPAGRAGPEQVDGDLALLSPEVLAALRADLPESEAGYRERLMATGLPEVPLRANMRRHRERLDALAALRLEMAVWSGRLHAVGMSDREINKSWWMEFKIDTISALALGRADAIALTERVKCAIAGFTGYTTGTEKSAT